MDLEKVFYTSDGKLYKAQTRREASDAEMNFPTEDMLKALTNVPMTREDMIAKINHIDFHKTQAVLEQPKKLETAKIAETIAPTAFPKAKKWNPVTKKME